MSKLVEDICGQCAKHLTDDDSPEIPHHPLDGPDEWSEQ